MAEEFKNQAVGVLMTGMGDDGAEGLGAIKKEGGMTLAQSEESCVVFGMPAEAIRLGAADHVLPPSRIVALLVELTLATRSAA